MNYAPFALASAFDQYLGDPFNPQNAFSYARCATLDAQERFPDAICASLDQWGLPRYYVPEAFGGMLRDFEQPLQLIRMLARRDLTVAIGHGKTFLGAVCVWVGATAEQALQVAERVCGGAIVSWGLTERDHGSDLLHNDTCAEAHAEAGSGYRISGEKWLINNATRGELISVLARTLPEGGPRGFDMLLIDKAELEDGSLRYLPKEHTHGIRGADISGIAFDHARVSNDARIGSRGAGLEIVLKGLQLTRTLCASLSLGAADHALRLAVRFARERSLYGRTLAELPLARRTLIDAYADQLLAEAVALVGTRSIQALPGDMSVTSAVVKYLVPTRTEAMLDTLADLMGARAFLVGVYADGMFQKVYRDNRIVSLFDGNTLVNLNAIVNEFQTIAKRYRRGAEAARTAIVFDLTAALPDFDRNALSLIARDGCGVVNALPALLESMDERAKREPELNSLTALTRWLVAAADDVHQQMLDSAPMRVRVPVGRIVASRGSGAEISLRSFQVTRIVLPGMAIGMLDTALRAVVGFARERRLYGARVIELPYVRSALSDVMVDLLSADCLVRAAARSLHLAPAHASVYAATVKYLVPLLLRESMNTLSIILGARAYLRDGPYAIFGKMMRDLPIVSVAHAGGTACLLTLLSQLPALGRRAARRAGAALELFDEHVPLPLFDFDALTIAAHGEDRLLDTLANACDTFSSTGEWNTSIERLVRDLATARDELRIASASLAPSETGPGAHPDSFALAQRYAWLAAAAACVGVWQAQRARAEQSFVGGSAWIVAALSRLQTRLGRPKSLLSPDIYDAVMSEIVARVDANRSLCLHHAVLNGGADVPEND